MNEVVIIDYEMSNLHSVKRALDYFDIKNEISNNTEVITNSKIVILPGVGAFPEAMNKLNNLHLVDTIKDFVNSGKPLIGICLGMQLLFEKSEEFVSCDGLGIIEGIVKKFKNSDNYKVPHIGWNKIEKTSNKFKNNLINFKEVDNFMYFVHSYYVEPTSNDIVASYTNYANMKFCSSINYNNIYAFQFHPEKSGKAGLNIYKNIKKLINAQS